jgi:hypothetical protein
MEPVQNMETGDFTFSFDLLNGLASGTFRMEHTDTCIFFSTIGFETGSRIGP